MTLDSRLTAVAAAVRPGSVAADVGTDHGYLICGLVASGVCPRGYASDVATGPLAAARRHILRAGLADRIEVVQSDGLESLPGEEIDDVILAGMGGELIAGLLTAVPWTKDADKRYILQPMTKADRLRRLLYGAGFALESERAVTCGRFVYTVMTAYYAGECREVDTKFAYTGLLWDNRDEDSQRYLERVAQRMLKRAAGLAAAGETVEAMELRRIIDEIGKRTGKPC